MKFRNLTTMVLALAMSLSLSVPAFAATPDASDTMTITKSGGQGSVPVTLTTEGGFTPGGGDQGGGSTLTFRVTLPTALPAVVNEDNEVITATNARITNLSAGPVEVTSLRLVESNGWDIVTYGTDLSSMAIGTKKIAMEINGCRSNGSVASLIDYNQRTFMDEIYSTAGTDYLWANRSAYNSMAIDYNIEIVPQGRQMHHETAASAVFTVAFYH